MQERRATVRTPLSARVQYCLPDDASVQDGRATDASERGLGLLVRGLPRVGESFTVTLPSIGRDDPLTASGTVRWSRRLSVGRWRSAIGVEWFPLDATTRVRWQAALQAQQAAASPVPTGGWALIRRATLLVGASTALGCLGLGLVWSMALQQHNQRLRQTLQHRNALIIQLADEARGLQRDLHVTTGQLLTATDEVGQLNRQTRQLAGDMERLRDEVGRIGQSYERLKADRSVLMQRVLDLERQRLASTQRQPQDAALRLAVREAIAQRRGNGGYLVHDGRQTSPGSTMIIRVHDPEPSSP